MSERVYTVEEVDDLRKACEDRYEFGSCAPSTSGRVGRSCRESDMVVAVEQMIRTHILAGHVAQQLIDTDIQKEARRRAMLNSPP